MKKCYIAGPITGTFDYKERFAAAEKEVEAMGMVPINPVTLPHDHDKSWNSYMKECLAAMMTCDVVYCQKDHSASPGARMEFQIASTLGYQVIFQ